MHFYFIHGIDKLFFITLFKTVFLQRVENALECELVRKDLIREMSQQF